MEGDAGWEIEGVTNYIPNMVISNTTAGRNRWFVVGSYVTLNDQLTVHWVEHTLVLCPKGTATVLVRNLNARLAQPCNRREEDLATAISNHGLEYQTLYFISW